MSKMLVPADFKIESVKKFDELNKRYKNGNLYVAELYGSLNPSKFGCTKNPKNLIAIDFEGLKKYCDELKKYNIEFNYILNFLCYGGNEFSESGIKDILDFVRDLYNIGIRKFTIANPVIAKVVGDEFDDVEISISVVYNVNTTMKLETLSKIRNVKRMYISEDVIREFGTIKLLSNEARGRGIELSTLLNSHCLIECPYKTAHANVDGHLIDNKKQDMPHYFYSWCSLEKLSSPKEILRLQTIRPEDIHLYEEAGISNFKVAGRELPNSDFLKTSEIYMSRSYDGNLMALSTVFSDNFFSEIYNINNKKLDGRLEHMIEANSRCREFSHCENCHICDDYYLNVISINEERLEYYRNLFEQTFKNFEKRVDEIK